MTLAEGVRIRLTEHSNLAAPMRGRTGVVNRLDPRGHLFVVLDGESVVIGPFKPEVEVTEVSPS